MKKLKAITASLLLAFTSSAFAQLIISDTAPSSLAVSLQNDPALLSYLTANTTSFTSGGTLFEQTPNFAIGDFVIGNGVDGRFFATVAFLDRDSLRPNHFGVDEATQGYMVGGIALFEDYGNEDEPVAKRIDSDTYTTINFWHSTSKPGYTGNYFHDDAGTFRTWTSFNSTTNELNVLFGIDDLRNGGPLVDDNDFNDGAFLVTFNLTPVSFEAVPEPSTYGLIAAGLLLAGAFYRRRQMAGMA